VEGAINEKSLDEAAKQLAMEALQKKIEVHRGKEYLCSSISPQITKPLSTTRFSRYSARTPTM